MTPSDICIVTVRDEPGVRFGDGFYDDVPAFKNIEAIVEREKVRPDEFHWERLGRQYAREVSRQEQDGVEEIPRLTYFPYPKTMRVPVVALRKPNYSEATENRRILYSQIPEDRKPKNARHLEFEIGARVQLSEETLKKNRWKQGEGSVVGYSKWPYESLKIKWDRRKTNDSIHYSYVERVPKTPIQ